MKQIRRFLRRFSLRTQIIVAFVAIGVFGFSLLALFYIRTTRTALIGQANQALYAAASRTATSLDAFIGANLEDIHTEASMPSVTAYISLPPAEREGSAEEDIIFNTLDELRNKDLFNISSYAILNENGVNLIDTTVPNIGQDESETDYFQMPVQTGRPYVSPVQFAPEVGTVDFYFSSPIRDHVGRIAGVLRARYSVALLQELVSESRALAGEESFAILLEENYIRLAHDAAPDLIFKAVAPLSAEKKAELQAANRLPNLPDNALDTNLPEFAAFLDNANEEPFFAATEQIDNGRYEQMAVVPLHTQPWLVVYAQPRDVFLSPIEQAIQSTIQWTLVFALALSLAAVIIARWLTEPVTHLTTVAEQITAGDLGAQAHVDSQDEIGRLAIAFNNMTAQLRQTLEGLEKREEALQESNMQLENTLIELRETQAQMVQQERVAAVGQMAAGIAHDFNNIMATIILYSDLLLNTGNLSAKDRERVKLIQQQGQRAADLTQQILDFSRKSIMQRQNIDLWLFLVEIEALLKRTLPENIHLSLSKEGKLSMVNADPTRLQQVILNLALNAKNAMPEGGELSLKLTSVEAADGPVVQTDEEPPDAWLLLHITDTGAGIPDNVVPHIFEPFFTTRAPQGSGLGLSQVDGIVKQHGGCINVETQLGVGTTFTIVLPALTELPVAPDQNRPENLYPGQKELILLVEDDDLIRAALTSALQNLNYDIISAKNGREALLQYNNLNGEIDLVLSDLVMPEMGGKELLHTLKTKEPALKTIVMTGYPLEQEAELRSLGVSAWCQKPVNLEELSRLVARVLHTPKKETT